MPLVAGDALLHQVDELKHRQVAIEDALGLGGLAQLGVVAIDDVGGVDQLAQPLGIAQEGAQAQLVRGPTLHGARVALFPLGGKGFQSQQGGLFFGGLLDGLQVGQHVFHLLCPNVAQGVADLVHDAALHGRAWEHRLDGIVGEVE